MNALEKRVIGGKCDYGYASMNDEITFTKSSAYCKFARYHTDSRRDVQNGELNLRMTMLRLGML